MGNTCCSSRMCSPALGMAFGIASGFMMMLLAWAGLRWGIGSAIIDQYSAIYYGYAATLMGGFFGLLWGFVEGFIFGFVVGWIYNMVARCCGCGKSSTCCAGKSSSESCK